MEESTSTVSFVQINKDEQVILRGTTRVIKFNSRKCVLKSMIDTGSPISFVSPRIYKEFLCSNTKSLKIVSCRYNALNNTPIRLSGVLKISIIFEGLPDYSYTIILHVMKDKLFTADLIIERDFLDRQKITVVYNPLNINNGDDFHELSDIFLSVECLELDNTFNDDLRNITIDFGEKEKRQLLDVIHDVQSSSMPAENDDYYVKLNLKEQIPYAYAPRRFAWIERQQLREITDDLLTRGILRESSSCEKKKRINAPMCRSSSFK